MNQKMMGTLLYFILPCFISLTAPYRNRQTVSAIHRHGNTQRQETAEHLGELCWALTQEASCSQSIQKGWGPGPPTRQQPFLMSCPSVPTASSSSYTTVKGPKLLSHSLFGRIRKKKSRVFFFLKSKVHFLWPVI